MGRADGIVLWPLGGYALVGPTESLGGDLLVALAGPIMHVPMGAVWWAIFAGITGGIYGWWPSHRVYLDVLSDSVAGFIEILAAQAFYMNLVLLCFNLFIPAYPLDGGRIYAAGLMLAFKMTGLTAAKVTSVTAMLISAGMIVWALLSVIAQTGGSVLLGVVGAFVFYQSYELFGAARRNDLDGHPLFGRECYRARTGSGNNDGGGDGGGDVEAATPVDAAVPA